MDRKNIAIKALLRKDFWDMAYIPLIVVLVGLGSFGLGRLSALRPGGEGQLRILEPAAGAASKSLTSSGQIQEGGGLVAAVADKAVGAAEPNVSARNFVASKNGTKYYLPGCSGASRIKEENKVWFESTTEAENAGFTPAANCSGL